MCDDDDSTRNKGGAFIMNAASLHLSLSSFVLSGEQEVSWEDTKFASKSSNDRKRENRVDFWIAWKPIPSGWFEEKEIGIIGNRLANGFLDNHLNLRLVRSIALFSFDHRTRQSVISRNNEKDFGLLSTILDILLPDYGRWGVCKLNMKNTKKEKSVSNYIVMTSGHFSSFSLACIPSQNIFRERISQENLLQMQEEREGTTKVSQIL